LCRFGKDSGVHLSRPAAIAGVVVSLVLPSSVLAACGQQCVESRTAPVEHDSSFVGRVTAKRDAAVDFAVESVQTTPGRTPDAHLPEVGATVTVHYGGGQEKFLHDGGHYRVIVDSEAGQYQSSIHEAQDCGNYSGTTHVNGSTIDTADFPWLHRAVLFFALAPVIGLAVLTGLVWNQRRRARRRTSVMRGD
jgi:hypothetical protein